MCRVEVPVISFGEHIIGELESYDANAISTPIEVSDLRGNKVGWKLTAQLSGFKLDDPNDGTPTLAGASVKVKDQTINAPSDSAATAPTKGTPLELISTGTSIAVMNAAVDTGMGVWSCWRLSYPL